MQLTNFQQVSFQQCKVTFGSERNKSCYLPCEVGGVFGTRSSGSSELGHGRWEGGHLLSSGAETPTMGTSQSADSNDPETGKSLNTGFNIIAVLHLGKWHR